MRFPLPRFEYNRIRTAVERFVKGPGIREKDTLKRLIRLARPTDRFVDVGAGVGLFSVALKPFVREVHAFEPKPESAVVLREKGIQHVYEMAVDEILGEQRFFMNRIVAGYSGFYPQRGTERAIMVKTTRLDALFSHIDMLKVDVEGAEWRVIRGLGKIEPRVICVEVTPDRLGFDLETFNGLFDLYENHIGTDFNMIFWNRFEDDEKPPT